MDNDARALYHCETAGAKEGILVEYLLRRACAAAIQVAKRPENEGKTIVAPSPDSGDEIFHPCLWSGEGNFEMCSSDFL